MITLNKQVINTQQFGLPEQFFNFESFSKNITKITMKTTLRLSNS